jgi:tetratricopeptide (TPR) repeat protein
VTQYEQAILADLNLAEPNLALGRALARMGHHQDSHRYLGRYNDLTDRPDQAAREFRAMAALEPKSVQPALLEGQIYLRTQQAPKAVAVTEAALKQHPDEIQLLERLAILKINRGDRPYARRLLNHWLELKPKATRPLWLLARCDFGDLKYAEGIEKLEKAIKRQPREADYWGFLGGGYLRMETPDSRVRAAEALAKAIELAPESAEYRDLSAQALQRLGRTDDARAEYLHALDYDPYRISCYTPVTQLSWRLNRPGAAGFFPAVIRSVQARLTEESTLWPRVWSHPQDVEARVKLARFLCRTADLRKTRYQLEQILELRPGWPEAKQLLATVQRAQEAL